MGRAIVYRPGKCVRIIKGLFYGEKAELDEVVVIKGKPFYKLVGRSHFWKPNEVKLINKKEC